MLKFKRLINVQIIQPLSVITSFKKRTQHYQALETQIQLQDGSEQTHDSLIPILSDIIEYQFTSLVESVTKNIVFLPGDFGLFYKAAIYRSSAILQKMILALEKDTKNYTIFLESLKHFGCTLIHKPILEVCETKLQLDDIFYILEQTKQVASYADVLDVLIDIHRQAFNENKTEYFDKIKQCAINPHNNQDHTFDDLVFLQDLKENNRQCDKSAHLYYMKNRYKMSFELFSEALLIISRRNKPEKEEKNLFLMKFILESNLCVPYGFEGQGDISLSEVLQECLLSAAWDGDLNKIDLLFDLGASANAFTQIPHIWSGRLALCQNTMVSLDRVSLLQLAVLRGDILLIEKLITKGVDINEKGSKGLGALHLACAGWQIPVNKHDKLYHYNLNVIRDLESTRAYTLNHFPVLFSQSHQASSLCLTLHFVRRLLDKGANINCVDDQGVTPLHMVAASKMPVEDKLLLTEFLLSYQADPNLKDCNNRMPIEYIQQDDAIAPEHKFKFFQLFQNDNKVRTKLKP